MKTVTQQKLDEIRENARSIIKTHEKPLSIPQLFEEFEKVKALIEEADQACIVSKHHMTRLGTWFGDAVEQTRSSLWIRRDPRFADRKNQVSQCDENDCKSLFTQAAYHIIKNCNRIEAASVETDTDAAQSKFFTDPYGQSTCPAKKQQSWEPARLVAA